MLEDSVELKDFLNELYPNLVITDVAKKSGQRVVYYGYFNTKSSPIDNEFAHDWGQIVLKVSEATSRAAITYIQKEVEILKQIDHPSYPKLHYSEVITQDPFTEEPLSPIRFISVEERINGVPLTNKMSSYKDEKSVIEFLIQTITIMDAIWGHSQKLVHRDLKPDNILVTDSGEIFIIDLGILREEGSSGVTNSLCSFGPCTPTYASPEQAINDKSNITFKSDLFSLGVIAYEMLSGSNPFIEVGGDNYIDDVLHRVCSYTPSNLTSLGFDADLDKVISKMMNKEPYKRYRTPQKALDDLNEIKDKTWQ